VACPPGAGAASAMRGKIRRRARASHVCTRSMACTRKFRARPQLHEATMGTQRCVGMRLARNLRISRPGGGGGPANGERGCAGGGGRYFLPPTLPPPPRITSGPGTLTPPLTVCGRPGKRAGCGPAASFRAGRSPWKGGPNGGGRSGGPSASPLVPHNLHMVFPIGSQNLIRSL